MNRLLSLLVISCLLFSSCDRQQGNKKSTYELKESCYAAIDERRYLEMTEYQVLKEESKLRHMIASGKIVKLKARKKIRMLKRKIDMAHIEYQGRKGKRSAWVAMKYLK